MTDQSAGPMIVCAGCGELSRHAMCNTCRASAGLPQLMPCALCDASLKMRAEVLPAGEDAVHRTQRGGYAGKCTAEDR